MKERFTNVAQKTLDVFVKFASTKAITALKDGFVLSMPITLVGSIFLLIANLPITGYTDFMARIFGSDWNLGLNQINNSTFNVLAMVIAVGIGYSYARNEKMDGISCGILTLVSFLIVSPSTLTVTSDTIKALGGDTATISNVLPNTWMGGNGIISAINRDMVYNGHSMTLLQTNAAINEGNSGGPLINMYGQVIGITNMKALSTGVEGIGFAIPTAVIRPIVNALLADGRVSGRVSIGITVGAISSAASDYYDLPEGLYISDVAEGSDAEKKGIQSGDMLLAVNGKAVTTTYDVSAVKDGLQVGDTVTLTIYRDGKTFDVKVKLVDTNDIS